MKKMFWWVTMNAGLAAAMYAGFIAGIEGAQYLVKFFVWAFCLPLGLLALTDEMQKKLAEELPAPKISAVGRVVACGTLVVLIWTGHVFTALAWGVWMLCGVISREGAKRHRAAVATAQA